MSAESPPTPRNRVRRHPERARYDAAAVAAVLDAAFLAHVAFSVDGQPFVIPMLHARDGERVLLHGSVSSRMLSVLAAGAPCSACVTVLDGLVLARSQFAHSVNFRSVVVFGRAIEIVDPAEKAAALHRLTEAVQRGRAGDCRVPDAGELAATRVLALSIEDASVKVREGGPRDVEGDQDLPHWAGVVPLSLARGAPVPDARSVDRALPAYLARADA
jgi:nitroimidazol reductase NimA-like FMN-containing flavoprotein (pyridoxamine 5'-phosphate oxidase superfamily)